MRPRTGARRGEAGFLGDRHGAPHPDFLEPSKVPLHIVCGPPGAGKTTYVAARASAGEIVLDLDAIGAGLAGSRTAYRRDPDRWLGPALWCRNSFLARLAAEPVPWPAAWLIVGEPEARWRQWWMDRLRPASITVLEVPAAVCAARVRADRRRAAQANEIVAAVGDWWKRYRHRAGDRLEIWRGDRFQTAEVAFGADGWPMYR